MKKLTTALFIVAIVFLFTIPALAAKVNTYRINEMGMSVSIPSELYAFTRGVTENDPNLSKTGLTHVGLLKLFHENDYMVILSEDYNYEILISQSDYDNEDYNQLSDYELKEMEETFTSGTHDDGSTCKCEIFTNSQTRFLKLQDEGPDGNSTTYLTILNGKWISFMLLSVDEKISSEMENYLAEIVDSATFDKASPFFTISEDPIKFSDTDSGVSFTVPAGWGQCEKSDFFGANFKDNNGNKMYYYNGKLDLDNEQSVLDETEARKFCNYSGYEIDSVEQETLNHIDYFKVSQRGTEEAKYLTSYLIYFDGKIYEFGFNGNVGSEDNEYTSAILSSIKYNSFPNANLKYCLGLPVISTNSQISKLILLSLFSTLLICFLPILIYRYVIKKAALPKSKAVKITIIYGASLLVIAVALFLFKVMNGLPAIGIVLFSILNYFILKSGKAQVIVPSPYAYAYTQAPGYQPYAYTQAPTYQQPIQPQAQAYQQPIQPQAPFVQAASPVQTVTLNDARYCKHCGAPLEPDSVFCQACGFKIQ